MLFRRPEIRNLLIKMLSLYKKISVILLRVRGLTEEGRSANRIVSGKTWDEFCDTLKAAGAAVSGMDPLLKIPLTRLKGTDI